MKFDIISLFILFFILYYERGIFVYSNNYYYNQNKGDDRFVFPFLLGGVTGAALAPAFWRPRYQPYYQPYYPPYRPYY